MRKRKVLVAFLAIAALLVLSGCGRQYVMDRPDMYVAPSVKQQMEKFTVVVYTVNPILDLSEGGEGRFAWTAILWDKTGKETKLLALNLVNFGGAKQFLVVIPKPLAEVTGCRLAVVDHGGKRFYNHLGEVRKLESISHKADVKKYSDFLLELGPNYKFVKELDINSAEFKALGKLYSDFRIKDMEVARKYVYQKYGSNLTSEQLEQLAKDDSIVRGFLDWLGRDWKLFVMFPFMDIGSTALVAGIAKVCTLPSIWGERIDRPGYMEYKPDAEYTAKMVLRGLEEYGAKQAVAATVVAPTLQADHILSDKLRAAIKGTPCENSSTYEEYNACVLEYNKAIK